MYQLIITLMVVFGKQAMNNGFHVCDLSHNVDRDESEIGDM